jgi:hypothetical protein
MKEALVAAGISDQAASLMVEMQMAVNDGRFFAGVERTPETTTPTRLEEFLAAALLAEAVVQPAGGARP